MWPRNAWLAVAALVAVACKAAPLDLGFAVALAIHFDDSVADPTLAAISKIAIDASGDETFTAPLLLDRPATRVERLVYRPLTTTRSLSLRVTAADDLDKLRAVGTIGPLALSAGHTLVADVVLSGSDQMTTDAFVDGDAGLPPPDGGGQIIDLSGELIQIPDGWTATVVADLASAGFVYRLADFSDPTNGDVYDNQPLRIVSLVAPFTDGFAVLAGRTVIELPSSGGSTIHDYTPITPDQSGALDHPADLHFAQTVGATAGHLLVCGDSTGSGDGVYQLSSSWAMTLVAAANNNGTVAFDPGGLFDNKTTPETYYSVFASSPGTLLRVSDGKAILPASGSPIDDIEVEPSGALAVIAEMPNDPLAVERVGEVMVNSMGAYLHTFTSIAVTSMTLTTGAIARLPTAIHVVLPDGLVDLHPDDSTTTIARSLSVGWSWQHATVPPASHALGAKPSYVILESNRGTNRDRLIQLTPP